MTTILLIIIAILCGVIIALVCTRPKVIEISDEAPASSRKRDAWLKLQNEGKEHLVFKDGKVLLRIVK